LHSLDDLTDPINIGASNYGFKLDIYKIVNNSLIKNLLNLSTISTGIVARFPIDKILPSSPNYSYTPTGCNNGTNVVALGCTINRNPTVYKDHLDYALNYINYTYDNYKSNVLDNPDYEPEPDVFI
jgi:hypothetical protein